MEAVKELIENTELKKVFDVTVPLPLLDILIDERAEEKQKSYKLDGFRIGKVPVEEIKKREAVDLFYSAADKAVHKLVDDIIAENNYKLASQVDVGFKKFNVNEEVKLTLTFELIPTVPEVKLNNVNIDYYEINVTDEDIDKSINKMMMFYKKWSTKDGSAENGDTAKINFTGRVDGEEFPGGKGENFSLLLGSGTFIGGFEEQLIGAKAGDKVLVKTKFPDSYHATGLAGKDAEFDVEVVEVLESSDTEITDEFVQNTFNVENVEVFRNSVKTELFNTYTNMAKMKVKDELVLKLNEVVDFELPQKALQERIQVLTNYKKQQGNNNIVEDEVKEEAIRSLKCGYIFSDLAEKNSIEVSDVDVTEEIMKEAKTLVGNEQAVIDFYSNNNRALADLKMRVLENRVIDFVLDNVNKNVKTLTIEEFNML